MKNLFKSREFILGTSLLLFVLLVIGVTYAIVVWTTTNYGITLSTSCFDVEYKLGKSITANLTPTNSEDVVDSKFSQIYINSDMAVSNISLSFKEECSRYNGTATIELNVTNIATAFTDEGDSAGSLKYFLIPYDSSEYPEVDTQHLSGEVFNFVTSGSITETGIMDIFTTRLNQGETKEYIIVFLIDAGLISEDILGASFTATVESSVEQKVSGITTPITDFTYVIGTGEAISSVPIYAYGECIDSEEDRELYNFELTEPITLSSNQILLTNYIGNNTEIVIPNTYTINGVTYNVVVLSSLSLSEPEIDDPDPGQTVGIGLYDFNNIVASPLIYNDDVIGHCDITGALMNNSTVQNVILGDNVHFIHIGLLGEVYENSANSLFYNDTSLETVNIIPADVVSMSSTFENCSSLRGTITINSCDVEEYISTFAGAENYRIDVLMPAHSTTATTASGEFDNFTDDYGGDVGEVGNLDDELIEDGGKKGNSAAYQSNKDFSSKVYGTFLPQYDVSGKIIQKIVGEIAPSLPSSNIYVTTYANDVCFVDLSGGEVEPVGEDDGK